MSDEIGVYEVQFDEGKKKNRKVYAGNSMVLDLVADENGLWASTSKGHVLWMSHEGQVRDKYTVQEEGNAIFVIEQDDAGNVWACLDLQEGMAKITPSGQVEYYKKAKGLPSEIEVVRQDSNGLLWCAGKGQGSYLFVYDTNNDTFKNRTSMTPKYTQPTVRHVKATLYYNLQE